MNGNPTRWNHPTNVRPRTRAPAWVTRIWWGPLIVIMTFALVVLGAQAYLTVAIIQGGTYGVQVALGALWLAGLFLGYVLPSPSPLTIPHPQRAPARGLKEQGGDE